jgi:hypothetical protein
LTTLALNSARYCLRVFFSMTLFTPYEPIIFCPKS